MTNEIQKKKEVIYENIVSLINQGNFPHGALIECQNSTDGENFARFIANALICRGENKPCRVCSDCIKAQGKGHPDIYIFLHVLDNETQHLIQLM